MRVMVMVKATKSSEAGVMPTQELFQAMGNYNEELIKAGIMLAGDGLQPSSKAVRVHFFGKERIVTDGPFTETKELIVGYWLWEVKSIEEAIDWVKRCPNPMIEDSDIDIRPLYEEKTSAKNSLLSCARKKIDCAHRCQNEIVRYSLYYSLQPSITELKTVTEGNAFLIILKILVAIFLLLQLTMAQRYEDVQLFVRSLAERKNHPHILDLVALHLCGDHMLLRTAPPVARCRCAARRLG